MTANSMFTSEKLQQIETNAALITKHFMHLTAYEESYRKTIADMNTMTNYVRNWLERDELDPDDAACLDEAVEVFEEAARAIAAYQSYLDVLGDINHTIMGG
ncbi:unnamed protein product [Ciceribacter sp. T2.26MG-112.2]|uniref:hypothetical protein n=1 Tax=Ciceribacter sp. T2.26MG-112.2 TaxID=3137154 RepID=UPI000E154E9F|nr:hypothetical protein [Ciceribacter naphthalenivorans]SSC74226.1 unnamed protein product [Ciceribacter naphthalenivorans]